MQLLTTLQIVRSYRREYPRAIHPTRRLDRQALQNHYRMIEEALLQQGVNNREHPEIPHALGSTTQTKAAW